MTASGSADFGIAGRLQARGASNDGSRMFADFG